MEKKHIDGLQLIKNDKIDLFALIKVLWSSRRTIYYSIGISVFIGLLVAFLSTPKYEVTATLLPSAEKSSSSMGGLSALAGMAGVNLGSMMGDASTIPAEIYPQVVNSYPFLNEFIHEKFNYEEFAEPISLYEYELNDSIESLGKMILKYTIRLPLTLKEAFQDKDDSDLKANIYGVINLSKDEINVLKNIEDFIKVDVDDNTGLVSITIKAKEPVVTAQYVQRAVELLQEYIINYKTKKARENLDFVERSYLEKKEEYEKLQKQFLEYKDSHRNIISERLDPEFQRLSDEYELVSSIYNELAKQLEQAKIVVNEQTPAFTILEPAKVPFEKSSPNKKMILVISVILGGMIGIGIIIALRGLKNLKKKF